MRKTQLASYSKMQTELSAAAAYTGVAGIAVGTWMGTATDVVQLMAGVVALGVGVFTALYYRQKWLQLKRERKQG